MFAFHRHIAAREKIVDGNAQRVERFGQPLQFEVGVFIEQIGDDDARLVQHDMAKPDTFAIAVTLDRNRARQVELETGTGDLLQFTRSNHFGDDHRRGFHRLDFFFAIGALRPVLHDENTKRATRTKDRHAEEGVEDFFAGLRQVAEGGMRLRIRKVQRLRRRSNRTDKTLTHLELGKMHGVLFKTFGGVEFEHAVRSEHIDGTHFRNHVSGRSAGRSCRGVPAVQALPPSIRGDA